MTLAAVSWKSPISREGVSGSTYLLSATITDTGSGYDNASFYYSRDNGATWNLIESLVNNTAAESEFNTTWDSTALADAATLFNVTVSNDSVGATIQFENVTSSTDVDNSVPSATYGTGTPSNGAIVDIDNFTITSTSDASVVNCTTSIKPTPSSANISQFATPVSNVCMINLVRLSDDIYRYNLSLTDGLNTTVLSTRTVQIDTKNAGISPGKLAAVTGELSPNAILVILAIGAYFVLTQTGKKKRR
tara:strand:- start:85 stop:828 length:744 start_codon:yes stop_codon:yes gene_type:complete